VTTFRVPLPPGTNNGYVLDSRSGHARMRKTTVLETWESEVALVVGDWQPPARTPLVVRIVVGMPKRSLRTRDVDGCVKYLVDRVIGTRRDQWVDRIEIEKVLDGGDGWAEVRIEPFGDSEELDEEVVPHG
jgi:Holliday junction resolvase RusA-like endonuclease